MPKEKTEDKAPTKMVQILEEDYHVLASLKVHPLTFADVFHGIMVKAGCAKKGSAK